MAIFIPSEALASPHGFFTRLGGVSSGPFASLNCSVSSKDTPSAVRENRARAAAALNLPGSALLGLTQVHGPAVVTVEEPWPEDARPEADAMVTRRPGLALGIITADCAPVLYEDREAGVVGAAHAGWRGAVGGVLEAVLDRMEALGARRERITAVVGPCIAQGSYEVGADLRDAALARNPEDARHFAEGRREGHWQFDLPGYCTARLLAAGAGRVEALGHDTLVEEVRFFSHRRRTLAGGGPIGHQLSAIAIEG